MAPYALHWKNASARFVVDATGGSAAVARRCGARFAEVERGNGDPRTLVEAFEYGWWYTAGLPNGLRLIACMTDSDLARRMRLYEPKEWQLKLAAAPNIGAIARRSKLRSSLVIRSSSSRRLDPAAGDCWLATGVAVR